MVQSNRWLPLRTHICYRAFPPTDGGSRDDHGTGVAYLVVRSRPRDVDPVDLRGECEQRPDLDTRWQADYVQLKQGRGDEHILATGRRQWRPGAVDNQRVPPGSEFLVPRWAT